MLSPSYLIKEVWEIPEFNFSHFLSLSLSNLLELEGKEKNSVNQGLQDFINNKIEKNAQAEIFKRNARSDWQVTENNIK